MNTRMRHGGLAVRVLSRIVFDAQQRVLFNEMRAFMRQLPGVLQQPIPQAMQQITPVASPAALSEQNIRELADVAALLDRVSPLGVCLRRSLTRYYFLRRAGVPVVVHFGAKFVNGKPDRSVTGHAWLTRNGAPYFDEGENWRGFTIMLTYPQDRPN